MELRELSTRELIVWAMRLAADPPANVDEMVCQSIGIADILAEADRRDALLAKQAKAELFPDWSEAPQWANWWAVDGDGSSYWYANKPYLDKGSKLKLWFTDGGFEASVDFPLRSHGTDWQETLCKRDRQVDVAQGVKP